MERALTVFSIICINHAKNIMASTGDRSQMFYTCLQKCLKTNCSESTISYELPLHLKLLQWTCSDDCKYYCMWPTVDWFVDAGIGVQQFYGKWPFIRFLGIQEPAAMLFSLLNMACHLIMIREFRKKVNHKTPYYLITHLYCLVCCQGWLWSAIFHVRDVRFTEIMDYLGALSMVMFSLYHFLIRITTTAPGDSLSLCLGFIVGSYFVYHGYTVFFIRMDYGYNMIINIAFGAINIVGWLLWCWRHSKQRPYVKQCALFTSLVAVTTLLEIGDFPPIFWVIDAHALWHLATSPLPILWYR
uniref:Post-GPI attachment to proteins factor 3 n=1 Tax=Eubosmina coregoni TaxID=186181 RepID=A0A4Y7LL68_9CRUS|nr:EOG090X0702 [Eubosmina coregoni]